MTEQMLLRAVLLWFASGLVDTLLLQNLWVKKRMHSDIPHKDLYPLSLGKCACNFQCSKDKDDAYLGKHHPNRGKNREHL